MLGRVDGRHAVVHALLHVVADIRAHDLLHAVPPSVGVLAVRDLAIGAIVATSGEEGVCGVEGFCGDGEEGG